MKTYFAFSLNKFATHKKQYLSIRRTLLSDGHVLVNDMIAFAEQNDNKPMSERLFDLAVKDINEADVCIIDATVHSFETNSLTEVALRQKKPTLLFVEKDNKYYSNFISEYLQIGHYNEGTYQKAITKFIAQNSGNITTKFNIILERKQRNYLEWADRFYRQSRSEIIRDLIDKKAEEDLNYQRNLEK